jgi:hypothetical protein
MWRKVSDAALGSDRSSGLATTEPLVKVIEYLKHLQDVGVLCHVRVNGMGGNRICATARAGKPYASIRVHRREIV